MILFNIFPFAPPPPPPLAFLCLKLFRSLYIWFSMPPVCHFPSFLYISLCCMTLDPLAGKWQLFCSSSQLLTEPKNTRSGVRSGLCSVRRAHVYAESRARMQVNTFAAGCKHDDVQTPVVRTRFPYNRAAESLARGRVRVRNESTQRGEQRGRSVTAD